MKEPAHDGLGAEAREVVVQPVPAADASTDVAPVGVSHEEMLTLADLWPSKAARGRKVGDPND